MYDFTNLSNRNDIQKFRFSNSGNRMWKFFIRLKRSHMYANFTCIMLTLFNKTRAAPIKGSYKNMQSDRGRQCYLYLHFVTNVSILSPCNSYQVFSYILLHIIVYFAPMWKQNTPHYSASVDHNFSPAKFNAKHSLSSHFMLFVVCCSLDFQARWQHFSQSLKSCTIRLLLKNVWFMV